MGNPNIPRIEDYNEAQHKDFIKKFSSIKDDPYFSDVLLG